MREKDERTRGGSPLGGQGTETGSRFIVFHTISTVNSQRQLGQQRKDIGRRHFQHDGNAGDSNDAARVILLVVSDTILSLFTLATSMPRARFAAESGKG